MIKFANLDRPEFAVLGLCTLNLALAVAALVVVLWPIELDVSEPPLNAAPSERDKMAQSTFRLPSAPLFTRSHVVRQPEPPAPAVPVIVSASKPAALAEPTDLQWRVTGIIIATAGNPMALIEKHGPSPQTRRIAVGDQVDGWQVEQIAARIVSFRRGANKIAVALDPVSETP